MFTPRLLLRHTLRTPLRAHPRPPLRRPPQLRPLTIHNPRPDPDSPTAEPMTITLTPSCIARLRELRAASDKPDLALRVLVSAGGCHGFQYTMSLADRPEPEDTVFEEEDGVKVVMDEASLELLKGSRIDWAKELIGSSFVVAGNPRAKSSCGCGTSFDVEF